MRKKGHKQLGMTAVLLAALLALTGCGTSFGTSSEPVSRQVIAMTTVMNLKAYGKNAEKGLDDGEKEINRLDKLLSVGSDTSEVRAPSPRISIHYSKNPFRFTVPPAAPSTLQFTR